MQVSAVRELLKSRQPISTQRRLTRVGAKLSIVMAEILFDTDQPALALRWWSTAMRAADEAGDRNLSDIALARAAFVPTYAGTPDEVTARIMPRLEQAPSASPAIAMLWGLAAMAHATRGERDGFERAIDKSRNTLVRCDSDEAKAGIFSFLPRKHAFFEARGRADLGDADGARDAAVRALEAFEQSAVTDPALVRFAYASAMAKSGEQEEACRLAAKAITTIHDLGMTPGYPVLVRAHDFNTLIDPRAAGALEWCETLVSTRNTMHGAMSSTRVDI